MSTYQRINRVLDQIEHCLMEPLAMQDLAKESCMSDFHFQRTFRALSGHSCMRYIRRRRLTCAFEKLKAGERILNIALDCQFESQEAFTRAFKAQFCKTPSVARKEGVDICLLQPRLVITSAYIQHLFGETTMEPVFKSIPSLTLVGMSAAFIPEKTNDTVIPHLWGLFKNRCGDIQNMISGPNVGVVNCLPLLAEGAEKSELVYLASAPVSSIGTLAPGLWATTIPAGDYAIFRTSVEGDAINKMTAYAYGAWLPKSGYTRGEGPELELYAAGFDLIKNPIFDYAIPVCKK